MLSRKGSCIPGQIIAVLRRRCRHNVLWMGDLMPCQRVLAPVTGMGLPHAAEAATAQVPPAGAGVGEIPIAMP